MGAIWETADSAVASKCQPTKDNWFPPCFLGQQGAQPIIHTRILHRIQHPFRQPKCPHRTMGQTALPGSPNQETVFTKSAFWGSFFEVFQLEPHTQGPFK